MTPGIRRPVRMITEPLMPSRQEAIRRTDISDPLRCDGGGLQSQPDFNHGLGGLADDGIVGSAPILQGEIKPEQLDPCAEHLGIKDTQGLFQQFLTGFVSVTNHQLRLFGHEVTFARVPWINNL